MIQVRALAEHLARFRPGGIQQHKQRTFAGLWLHLTDHSLRRHKLAGEHQVRLPLGISQQRRQGWIDLSARPAEGRGIGHHIGNQPTGVAGLQGLNVVHDQAHAGIARHWWAQITQAMAERHPTPRTTGLTRTTGSEGFEATGQALGAQAGYGMAHAGYRRRKHTLVIHSPAQEKWPSSLPEQSLGTPLRNGQTWPGRSNMPALLNPGHADRSKDAAPLWRFTCPVCLPCSPSAWHYLSPRPPR